MNCILDEQGCKPSVKSGGEIPQPKNGHGNGICEVASAGGGYLKLRRCSCNGNGDYKRLLRGVLTALKNLGYCGTGNNRAVYQQRSGNGYREFVLTGGGYDTMECDQIHTRLGNGEGAASRSVGNVGSVEQAVAVKFHGTVGWQALRGGGVGR